MERTSLSYIFFTFLKLGATAFGGYMSLVAIVQKQLVEVDKKLKEEDLLDGISLTSVLPGPVAVNTIAYVGYQLRGVPGAIAAFAGIILPSFFLVIFLSWLYFSYGNIPAVKNVFTKKSSRKLIRSFRAMKSSTIWRSFSRFLAIPPESRFFMCSLRMKCASVTLPLCSA